MDFVRLSYQSKLQLPDKFETLADVQEYLTSLVHVVNDSHTSLDSDLHRLTEAIGVDNGNAHDHNGGDGGQVDHVTLASIGTNTHAQVDTHLAASAPHSGHELTANRGATNGYCPLASSLVPGGNLGSGTPSGSNFLRGDRTWAAAHQYVAAGSFTRDTTTATGTQDVTGLSFQPKAVFFLAAENLTNEVSSGFDTQASRYCIAYVGYSAYWAISTTTSILDYHTSGNNYQGYVSSWLSNGFRISWTRTGAPSGTLTTNYMAFG